MSNILSRDFLTEVAKGNVPGHSVIHKFGHANVATTVVPISSALVYRTPTVPTALEVVSTSANDAVGGSGAAKVTIQGLDLNWEPVTVEVELNGITPVPVPVNLFRLARWYISETGTYADSLLPSYAGNLTIQEVGAGPIWALIEAVSPFAGQSEIGVYTIPKGYSGYLLSKHVFTDTSKIVNVFFLFRPNADDVTAPYTGARRILQREVGIAGATDTVLSAPRGPYVGPTDLGFMGQASGGGGAEISVEFELLIVKDGY